MMTAQQIADRLNDRFRLLTGGRRTALPRQQTLQALIDWSWNLLTEPEQLLWQRLSVFSGGWTLSAAQEVAGFAPLDELGVLDELEQLINKSLVTAQRAGPEARYGMLESIRQYGQERVIAAGEAGVLRERHAAYFTTLVDEYGANLNSVDFFERLSRLAPEADNLRAVMEWIGEERPAQALHFSGTLLRIEIPWIPYREARSWLEPAIAHARARLEGGSDDVDRTDYMYALHGYGWQLITHGALSEGIAALDECIAVAREQGDAGALALALGAKAQAMGGAVTREIVGQIEETLPQVRSPGHESELGMLLFSAGMAFFALGEPAAGMARFEEAVRLLSRFEEAARLKAHAEVPYMRAWVQFARARMALAAQDLPEAEALLQLAAGSYDQSGNKRMAATMRSTLAHTYRQSGRVEEAAALYRRTILFWQEIGHQSAVAHQIECFAYHAVARGQFDIAARLLGAARAARELVNQRSSDPQEIAELSAALGRLEQELGAPELERLLALGELLSLDGAVDLALASSG